MHENDLLIPLRQQKLAFARDGVWMRLPEKERAESLELLIQLLRSVALNQERIPDEREDQP
jgi:hypothetical protein